MYKLKQFGAFRWRGNSLYLDYRLKKGGKRQRPVFATLRTGSISERRQLEAEARKHLDEIEYGIRKGTVFESSVNVFPTYKQAALFYWEKHELQKEYIKKDPGTQAGEWFKVQAGIRYFGDRHVDEIKREDIKLFRCHLRELGKKAKRPWSDAYINRFVSKVGQVYRQLINQEYWHYDTAPIDPVNERVRYGNINACVNLENPTHGLSKLYEKAFVHFIPTPEQFMKGWDHLLPYQRMLALIGIHTGLRRRNVVYLKWSDVNLVGGRLEIKEHKGNKPPLIIRMHEEVYETIRMLDESKKISEYVICQSNGKPYRDFHVTWNRAWENAGLPRVRFRDLRTIYASWRVEEGVELGLLQRALGHSTPTTTGRVYNRSQRATDIIVKTQRPLLDCDRNCDQSVTNVG